MTAPVNSILSTIWANIYSQEYTRLMLIVKHKSSEKGAPQACAEDVYAASQAAVRAASSAVLVFKNANTEFLKEMGVFSDFNTKMEAAVSPEDVERIKLELLKNLGSS
jgi:hypothetical protein